MGKTRERVRVRIGLGVVRGEGGGGSAGGCQGEEPCQKNSCPLK